MANLIDDIAAFIETHELSESQFGVLALNDKNLIPDMRDGRDMRMSTVAKLRAFMDSYEAGEAA